MGYRSIGFRYQLLTERVEERREEPKPTSMSVEGIIEESPNQGDVILLALLLSLLLALALRWNAGTSIVVAEPPSPSHPHLLKELLMRAESLGAGPKNNRAFPMRFAHCSVRSPSIHIAGHLSFSSSSPIPYPPEGSGGGDPEDIAPTSGESISNPPAVSGNGPETATIPDLSAPAPRNRALSPSPSPYMEIDSGPYQLTRRASDPISGWGGRGQMDS